MPFPAILEGRLRLPLVAAPMFLASGPDLVLACCRAGIVGSFPAKNQRTPDGLDDWLQTIRDGLRRHAAETGTAPPPFAVNLIVHRSNETLQEELAMCVRHEVPLVITSLGAVPELVDSVHGYGGLVFHDVINLRHARKAIDAGVDGLIAVAAGAGGHTGRASPFALVNEIRQIFDGTLLLSGAMANGSDIAAAQMMGADLAYLGTRFIGTRECDAPAAYKEMIVGAVLKDIVETDRVSGVNANFLAPSLAAAGLRADGDAPEMDIDSERAETPDDSGKARAWRDIWSAGQGVGSIHDLPTVESLVARMTAEYHAACAAQQDRLARLGAGFSAA
ncbi:MAG: nitronate monooxygenase family protein [Pseudomonadota bacterium]|nr:nitronate monooxygenase family protein [Pseudomonadota bacterium]